jgi:hypothetical protein
LAAFIFRETGESASGVGLGCDMVMIQETGKTLETFGPDAIKKVESGIPCLSDSLYPDWMVHSTLPEWLKDES